MKGSQIKYILQHKELPLKLVEEVISKVNDMPLIKMKEISELNSETGILEKNSEFYCQDCGNTFKYKGAVYGTTECPHCGIKHKNINTVVDEIPLPQTTKYNLCINDEITNTKRGRSCTTLENVVIRGIEDDKLINTVRDFFIVKRYNIENKDVYALLPIEISIFYNYIENEKEIWVRYTDHAIIFTDKEVINVRNGVSSNSSIYNVYNNNYFLDKKFYIIGEQNDIKSITDLIIQLDKDESTKSIITNTKYENLFSFNACLFDAFMSRQRNNTVKPKTKRDLQIQDIIDSLPAIPNYEAPHQYLVYEITKQDNIKKVVDGRYTCPFCKKTIELKEKDYYYFSHEENFDFCPECGESFESLQNISKQTLQTKRQVVVVVQDMDKDKVVVRTAHYKLNVNGQKMVYENTDEPKEKSHIFIIGNNNGESLLSNTTIITYNINRKKYNFRKDFCNIESLNAELVLNFAKNNNSNFLGVEELYEPQYRKDDKHFVDFFVAQYLLLCQKYPVLEKLLKAGFQEIVLHILYEYDWQYDTYPKYFDISQENIHSALKLSKGTVKFLDGNKYRQMNDFKELQALYLADNTLMEKDYRFIKENNLNFYTIEKIITEFGLSTHQVCAYLERVRGHQCMYVSSALSEWYDYLRASKSIGSDLNDRRVKYPSALKTEHDKVVYKQRIIESASYETAFKKITDTYGRHYEDKGKDFIITYPKNLKDLFEEGRMLNHCVGTYGDLIKNGESIILFVRKREEPKKPYFTIEVNPKRKNISQFYGFNDLPPNKKTDAKLIEYVKDWAYNNDIEY